MLKNSKSSWGALSRLLHWAMAVIIFYQIGMGVWMSNFVQDVMQQFALVQIHKSWGFVVFALAVIRVIWRVANPTPSHPHPEKKFENLAADLGHFGLYGLMFLLPLSGWLMASASPLQDSYGIKNKVFGQFEMFDPFVPGSQNLTEIFATVHFFAAIALTLLLLGHAGAALFHHFFYKDEILKRMTYGSLK